MLFRFIVFWALIIMVMVGQSAIALAQTAAGKPLSAEAQDAINKGITAAKAGDYPQSVGFFQAARKISPNAPEIFYDLGLAESKIPGRELRAMAWFGAYLSASPNAPNGAAVRKEIGALDAEVHATLTRMVKTAQDLAAQSPDYGPQKMSRVAGLWAKAGNMPAALEVISRIKKASPYETDWRPNAYLNVAFAQAESGDIEGAKRTADFIEVMLYKSRALGAIAVEQIKKGNRAGAKDTLDAAVDVAIRVQDVPGRSLRSEALMHLAQVAATVDLENQYLSTYGGNVYGDYNQIQTLVFGDGTTMSLTGPLLVGTAGSTVNGTTGNDILIGGPGTETLNGNGGSDTFFAGTGVETLVGGTSNDTYVYRAGDGSDTIIDSGGTNTLHLGTGLTSSNVLFSVSGNDLLIKDGISGDQVTLHNQYNGDPVQTLVFGNGSTLSLTGGVPLTYSGNGSFTGPANSTFIGGAGTETLTAAGGNNSFIAGVGTETLIGGSGNNTYAFAQGNGQVSIRDTGGTNSLILGSGLTVADVTFALSSSGTDLLIGDGTSGDQIDLVNQYSTTSSTNTLQTLVFGDGSTMNLSGSAPVIGASGASVGGTAGNSLLIAGQGNETLTGTGGNDTFIGGAGTDSLVGGGGNDTYLFYRGGGQNTVVDSGSNNVIQFAQGIATDQLWFAQAGNDLLVSVIGTTQTVDVQNWYANAANQNETFKTSDGHALVNTQVQNLVNAMASVSPPAVGQTTLPTAQATTLEPVIAANWH